MDHHERLEKEIVNEDAYLWTHLTNDDNVQVIIKAPFNVAKSLINGCKAELIIGIDKVDEFSVIHTGLKVYDMPENPIIISGTNLFDVENKSLIELLKSGCSQILLCNETSYCLGEGLVILNSIESKKALTAINKLENIYTGKLSNKITKSLDAFEFSIGNNLIKNVKRIQTLSTEINIKNWIDIDVTLCGLETHRSPKVTNYREGSTLEDQVWFTIENLFVLQVHHNPRYKSRSGFKELTDILAYYYSGIFIIETKCISIFTNEADISTEKKIKLLKKHIRKGLNQVIGAKRNIENNNTIFNVNGEEISFERNIKPHCLIIVAELFPLSNYEDIVEEVKDASRKEDALIQVLDFREIINILRMSQKRIELFDYNLMQRHKSFMENNSLNIRMKLEKKQNEKY
jgi:hypothetical protein